MIITENNLIKATIGDGIKAHWAGLARIFYPTDAKVAIEFHFDAATGFPGMSIVSWPDPTLGATLTDETGNALSADAVDDLLWNLIGDEDEVVAIQQVTEEPEDDGDLCPI